MAGILQHFPRRSQKQKLLEREILQALKERRLTEISITEDCDEEKAGTTLLAMDVKVDLLIDELLEMEEK